uniref:Uncharacterized protein n=1 Tax=Aegilops tauschii subsp. strangulata TaxID=200361 RepID=A0A453DM98_AEGTS
LPFVSPQPQPRPRAVAVPPLGILHLGGGFPISLLLDAETRRPNPPWIWLRSRRCLSFSGCETLNKIISFRLVF